MNTKFIIAALVFPVTLLSNQPSETTDSPTPPPHRYDSIAPEYLSSFPLGEEKDHRDEKGKNGIDLNVPTLDERHIASLCLPRLKADEDFLAVQPASTIADKDVWTGVRLYSNPQHNPVDTIVGSLAPLTKVGRLVLARMLTDLTRNTALLQERQDLIRLLAHDDHAFDKYTTLLKKFKKYEGNLLALLRPNDALHDPQIPKMLGHQKGAAGLTAMSKVHSELLAGPLTLLGIPLAIFAWKFVSAPGLATAHRIQNPWFRNGLRFSLYLTPVMYATMPILLPYALMQQKKVYLYVKRRLRSLHYFTKTLAAIAKYDLPIISPQVEEIVDDRSKKVTALVTAIADKTLRKDNWFLQGGSNVYRALDAISNGALKKALRGLSIIGQLDAYLTIARLMRDHKNQLVKYCYTEFLPDANARIETIDFWHPGLNPTRAVGNSLQLGGTSSARGLVLTGVNEGGKSTAMRALALCLILGQTFGVAPARRCAFTPFKIIRMSMNTVDDLSADQSLFKAEVDNAYAMTQESESLGRDEHAIYFLDEIFTGTERVEGEAAAYAIARNIIDNPRCLITLATHYPGLINLEADTNGAYRNMHVEVNIKDGVFHYPYHLEKGPTTQQIAIDILEREKFNPTIIDMARRVLSSPEQFIPTAADV